MKHFPEYLDWVNPKVISQLHMPIVVLPLLYDVVYEYALASRPIHVRRHVIFNRLACHKSEPGEHFSRMPFLFKAQRQWFDCDIAQSFH
jgi:hypothetical protein